MGRTEAVLLATTTRLGEAEAALEARGGEVARLEAKLLEQGSHREEREKLVGLLEQEQAARAVLLEEKACLLGRLEDTEAMLAAAARSKDLAVAEIRAQVERQDDLRKELASVQEEVLRMGAELEETKREAEVGLTLSTTVTHTSLVSRIKID